MGLMAKGCLACSISLSPPDSPVAVPLLNFKRICFLLLWNLEISMKMKGEKEEEGEGGEEGSI